MVGESFLSDAGWVFFAAWSVIVAAVSFAAFGRDLLPSRIRLEPPEARPIDPARARDSGGR
ncbi:MAG: hypothetical protein ACLP6G_18290 [Terriglobales bacterium]